MTTVSAAREDGSAEPSSETRSLEADRPEAAAGTQAAGVDGAPDSRSAKQPEASDMAESAEFEAAAALPQVLKIVGSVVAPSTLLTALLFYFGLVYAIGFFRYFGVNFTVLNLPFQDYLILSVGGSLIPLIYVTAAALLALWLYQLPLKALSAGSRRIVLRVLMPSAAIAGVVLVSLAMINATFQIAVFPATWWEARGLSLSIGVLLLAYAARLRRMLTAGRRPGQVLRRVPEAVVVAKWGTVFILVSVGLFWAVGSYATGAGEWHAHSLEAELPYSPDVLVYSEKGQGLQGPGVREVTCQNPNAAYRFRYDGLKLVPQSGNQYLFLPAGWTRAHGAAILIPRSDAIRLEFSQPGQVPTATC